MSEQQLKEEIDRIISHGSDDERAHSEEDNLHLDIIEAFCPDWVQKEVQRLSDADFNRWRA